MTRTEFIEQYALRVLSTRFTDSVTAPQSSRDALTLMVKKLEDGLDRSCECPDPNCDCPGCSLVREENLKP